MFFFFVLGPVFVEFPIDVLYPYELVRKEAGIKVFSTFIIK